MRGPSQEFPPRIQIKINESDPVNIKDLKPELKNPLTDPNNLYKIKNKTPIVEKLNATKLLNNESKLNEKNINKNINKIKKTYSDPRNINKISTPHTPPPDPAEVFRANLELALSDNDLGSSDLDPTLTVYTPNQTGLPTKETVRKIDDEELNKRIVELRREVGKLDDASKPESVAQTLMLNSMLGIYVDEAEKRGINTTMLVPSDNDNNVSRSSTNVSDLFKPTGKETPRPATGLEDVSVGDLEKRRANLVRSGLDQQTIEFLTRSIDQELEFRRSQE